MRKSFRLTALLLTVLLLLPALASCLKGQTTVPMEEQLAAMSVKDRATKLIELADEKMSKYDSYTAQDSMTMSTTIQGMVLSVQGQGTTQVQGQNKSSVIYKSTETITTTMDTEQTVETVTEGYQSGYMYELRMEDNIRKSAVRSPLSASEYRKFIKETKDGFLSSDESLDGLLESTIAHTKSQNGVHTLRFKDFDASFVQALFGDMGDALSGAEFDIQDMELTVRIGSDYGYESIGLTAKVVLSVEGLAAPIEMPVTVETVYASKNSTTVTEEDISTYKTVADLRVLTTLPKALETLKNAEQGQFVLTIGSEESYVGQKNGYEETDTVKYGTKDDKFTYEVTCETGDITYMMTYADGLTKMYLVEDYLKTEMDSAATDDSTARQFVYKLIDYAGFDRDSVVNITQAEEDEDTLILDLLISEEMKESFGIEGGTYQSGKYQLTVCFEEGSLITYDSYMEMCYSYNGFTYKRIVYSQADFSSAQ